MDENLSTLGKVAGTVLLATLIIGVVIAIMNYGKSKTNEHYTTVAEYSANYVTTKYPDYFVKEIKGYELKSVLEAERGSDVVFIVDLGDTTLDHLEDHDFVQGLYVPREEVIYSWPPTNAKGKICWDFMNAEIYNSYGGGQAYAWSKCYYSNYKDQYTLQIPAQNLVRNIKDNHSYAISYIEDVDTKTVFGFMVMEVS